MNDWWNIVKFSSIYMYVSCCVQFPTKNSFQFTINLIFFSSHSHHVDAWCLMSSPSVVTSVAACKHEWRMKNPSIVAPLPPIFKPFPVTLFCWHGIGLNGAKSYVIIHNKFILLMILSLLDSAVMFASYKFSYFRTFNLDFKMSLFLLMKGELWMGCLKENWSD